MTARGSASRLSTGWWLRGQVMLWSRHGLVIRTRSLDLAPWTYVRMTYSHSSATYEIYTIDENTLLSCLTWRRVTWSRWDAEAIRTDYKHITVWNTYARAHDDCRMSECARAMNEYRLNVKGSCKWYCIDVQRGAQKMSGSRRVRRSSFIKVGVWFIA
jgi:hypothetical protein